MTIRGEDLLELKLKALDRLAEKGMDAVLVAAIERGVNTDEVGANLKFGWSTRQCAAWSSSR